jgi:hypothetical protein
MIQTTRQLRPLVVVTLKVRVRIWSSKRSLARKMEQRDVMVGYIMNNLLNRPATMASQDSSIPAVYRKWYWPFWIYTIQLDFRPVNLKQELESYEIIAKVGTQIEYHRLGYDSVALLQPPLYDPLQCPLVGI